MSEGKLYTKILFDNPNWKQNLETLDEAKEDAPRELKETIWYSDDDVQEMRKWFKKWFATPP